MGAAYRGRERVRAAAVVRCSGEGGARERERKRERIGAHTYDRLGAKIYGTELDVRVTSDELPAMSPPRLLRV